MRYLGSDGSPLAGAGQREETVMPGQTLAQLLTP